MKRFLKSLGLAIGLLLVFVSVGYGLFNFVVNSPENKLQSGKVSVAISGDPVYLENISPGESGEVYFQITNTGTLPVTCFIDFKMSGKLFEGDTPIQLQSMVNNKYIAVGDSAWITIVWIFPDNANNEYQGQTGTFTVVVNAQQTVEAYP